VCVGLANFGKNRFSRRVIVILGMMFQGEVSVSFLNLVKAGIARYSQDLIVGPLSVRILLVKEGFFTFGLETILVVELLKGSMGILRSILVGDLVIVITTGWI